MNYLKIASTALPLILLFAGAITAFANLQSEDKRIEQSFRSEDRRIEQRIRSIDREYDKRCKDMNQKIADNYTHINDKLDLIVKHVVSER